MTDLELLVDLHRLHHRQGPGGDLQTALALRLTGFDPAAQLNVADIGCGTGAPTLALAGLMPQAQIIAVDFLEPFLVELQQRTAAAGVAERVTPLQASMDALPFGEDQFDLLWSEGAIYNMGFENGVKSWRRFLKPGGVLVASEITWTTRARPTELQAHWDAVYPEIDTASAKIRVLEQSGYSPLGYLVLPEACWLDGYYHPLQAGFSDFLNRHGHSAAAQRIVAAERREIALYEANRAHLSYGLYVARKIG